MPLARKTLAEQGDAICASLCLRAGNSGEQDGDASASASAPYQDALAADAVYRAAQVEYDTAAVAVSKLQRSIAAVYKSKGPTPTQLLAEMAQRKEEMTDARGALAQAKTAALRAVRALPNVLHPSVPAVSPQIVSSVRIEPADAPELPLLPPLAERASHVDLLTALGGLDTVRGAKIAGSRGYVLRGPVAMLNRALGSYGLAYLGSRGYTHIAPPLMMTAAMMANAAELGPHHNPDDMLYTVDDGASRLVPSAEQPLAALHAGEILDADALPVRYAGFSQCFRREASESSARSGLFRVHVFDKVEQFVITTPDDGPAALDAVVATATAFYTSLGLDTNVVAIPAPDLSHSASLKYDIEARFAGSDTYRELVSATSTGQFQARALNVRYRTEAGDLDHVCMVNATLVATHRTLCALVEAWQTPDGVIVPPVLRPFMLPPYSTLDLIPFVSSSPSSAR